MSDHCIKTASFNPKVRAYWTLIWVLVSGITIVGIALIPLIAIIAWLVSDKVLKATSAKLLERKLVVKRGIIFVVEKSIPLEKITDVALSQGPVMRLFGLYGLSFETAGQSAQGALVSLVGINEAEAFREAILKQKDSLKSDRSEFKETESKATESTAADDDIKVLTASVRNIEAMLAKLVDDKTS